MAAMSTAHGQHVALPEDFRSEQIYISPERTTYDVGDTIDVSGVVTCISRDGTRPYSRYLYLELIGPADTVEVRQKLACHDGGRFRASVPTDLLGSGTYYLRAYTQLMRNFSPLSFAFQELQLGSRKASGRNGIKCYTAAEGGSLRAGQLQRVTGVVTDAESLPAAGRTVRLMTAEGDTIGTTTSSTSGFASFSFIPESGRKYELAVGEFRFALPEAVESTAPSISGTLKGNRISYAISGKNPGLKQLKLYIYDRMNGISVASPRSHSGTIALERTPDIATVFLTDTENNTLAQFTSANPATGTMDIKTDERLTPGATVNFDTGFEQSDSVTVMARLVKANEARTLPAEAALRFTADYSSPLPFPQRYALSDNRERSSDLSAWLSTATFKRFPLKDALDEEKAIYRHMPEFTMQIKGTAKDKAQRPQKQGAILAYDSNTFLPYDAMIDQNGNFDVNVGDYYEGTEFFLQWLNKKGKPENAIIELADESYPAVKIERRADEATYHTAYDTPGAGITGNVHQLDDIIVRARVAKQNRFEEKVFYAHRAKDREKIEERAYLTLLDILKDLPTLTVAKKTLEDPEGEEAANQSIAQKQIIDEQTKLGVAWVIKTHRGSSTLAEDGAYVPLYIDGNLYEPEMYDMAFSMPANDIESVEFLTPAESLVFTSNCLNGAVSVKTRSSKFTSRQKAEAKGVIVTPPGLSIARPQSATLKAPATPGEYILQVDVITPSGIHSSARAVKIN